MTALALRGRQPDIHHIERRDAGAQRDRGVHDVSSTSDSSWLSSSRGEPSSCALPCARLKYKCMSCSQVIAIPPCSWMTSAATLHSVSVAARGAVAAFVGGGSAQAW